LPVVKVLEGNVWKWLRVLLKVLFLCWLVLIVSYIVADLLVVGFYRIVIQSVNADPDWTNAVALVFFMIGACLVIRNVVNKASGLPTVETRR
jgi:hypothetical protein